ncbi:MAG: transcriptional repressor [Eubacteriales bacterium]|nr:transcriptional repressor [Eubacteriales bacterium]
MRSRPKYNTKQKEILLGYFKSIPGIHVTAGEVFSCLRSRGESIGQATVYRQLESLVDEGMIRKYIINGNSPACYEYAEPDDHADGGTCFHCKCEKCGKLIHLSCDELTMIQAHLASEHNFRLDPVRTVFYGLCEECR